MEPDDIKDVVKILSTAYLCRKKGVFPGSQEVSDEMNRRERWIGLIMNKHSGEEAFLIARKEIYNDPPENFR